MTIPRHSHPRRSPLRRSVVALKRRTKVKNANRRRKHKEFVRCYGSKDRCAWVQAQPCIICGLMPSENAHITSDGAGRKADARQIVPLCRTCHLEFHQHGRAEFEHAYEINLPAFAAETDRSWQTHRAERRA